MERVMTVEEKIRRAEEIYQRRRQGEIRPVAKVTVNDDKKDIKLLKKMVIQILICVAIYLIVYAIQSNPSVFSEDFIKKTNEILSYDTNFAELYEMVKNQVMAFMKQDENAKQEQNQETQTEESEKKESAIEATNEAIGGAEEPQEETPIESLSEEEQRVKDIKNTTTFIKPIEGMISSKFGQRDTATGSVPKNHTGIDIAANLGTKIKAATAGEVVLASEEGDYRKTFKDSNW